jgi:tetratricopeptide (TPR) repeat protein
MVWCGQMHAKPRPRARDASEKPARPRAVAPRPANGFLLSVLLKWRLSHVRGYLQLGMNRAAQAELDAIPAADARRPEVLALRVALLQETKRWRTLRKLAGELVDQDPEEAAWWVIWAYASRRAASLATAERILLQAEARHPRDATIQFNLGCYACLRGDLETAQARVARAIQLDDEFRASARTDPDLAALRVAVPQLFQLPSG